MTDNKILTPNSVISIANQNSEFWVNLGLGKIPGWSGFFMTATSTKITNIKSTIWENGTLLVPPTVAAPVDIISTDPNDTALGTGCREVSITGLGAGFLPQSEIVPTNGTSISTTSLSFLRINSMIGSDFGSNNTNEGDITAQQGSNPIEFIVKNQVQARTAFLTTPAGFSGMAIDANIYGGKNDEFDLDAVATLNVLNSAQTLFTKTFHYQNGVRFLNKPEAAFPEKTDFTLQSTKTGSSGTVRATIIYQFLIIDNKVL